MKNLKITLLASLVLFSLTSNTFSQDYAFADNSVNSTAKSSKNVSYDTESSVLKNNTYTYEYKGKDVIVIFNNDEHIEYYNNKKYYIKSKLTWTNKYECEMTIIEATLPDVPFKAGTKLNMKVTKTQGNHVFYESTLGGRTWEGKMKLSNYNKHF